MPEHVAIAIKREVLLTPLHVSFDDINNSHCGRFTPRKEPRYPQYRRLGGPHGPVEYNVPCLPPVFGNRALHPST